MESLLEHRSSIISHLDADQCTQIIVALSRLGVLLHAYYPRFLQTLIIIY